MATEVAATTASSSAWAATKAFAVAHPLTMAAAGGAVLGVTTYYLIGRSWKKRKARKAAADEAKAVMETATA